MWVVVAIVQGFFFLTSVKMAARVGSLESSCVPVSEEDLSQSETLMFDLEAELGSLKAAGCLFRRYSAKLMGLSGCGGAAVKTDLNLLLDELLSHNCSGQFSAQNVTAQVISAFFHLHMAKGVRTLELRDITMAITLLHLIAIHFKGDKGP